MAHTHPAKYSWYNTTTKKSHYWEDKEVLNFQRRNGEECVNVESDILISKKQMSKGPSKALIQRVTKNISHE